MFENERTGVNECKVIECCICAANVCGFVVFQTKKKDSLNKIVFVAEVCGNNYDGRLYWPRPFILYPDILPRILLVGKCIYALIFKVVLQISINLLWLP